MREASRSRGRRVALIAIACVALVIGVLAVAAVGAFGSKRASVKIKGFAYHAKTLKIKKGTKVAFTNKDSAVHTATDKGVFNTGRIKQNQTKTITFKHKGTYKYICTIHPFMHGKIIVR